MEENEFVFSLHSSHCSFFYSCLILDLCLIYAWFILETLMILFPYFHLQPTTCRSLICILCILLWSHCDSTVILLWLRLIELSLHKIRNLIFRELYIILESLSIFYHRDIDI